MRRLLLVTVALLSIAAVAMAQPVPGSIDLMVDNTGLSCDLVDAPGLIEVWVFHIGTNLQAASRSVLQPGERAS